MPRAIERRGVPVPSRRTAETGVGFNNKTKQTKIQPKVFFLFKGKYSNSILKLKKVLSIEKCQSYLWTLGFFSLLKKIFLLIESFLCRKNLTIFTELEKNPKLELV